LPLPLQKLSVVLLSRATLNLRACVRSLSSGLVNKACPGLSKEIEQVRREIEQAKASIVKWVAELLVVQTGVIVSIITLLG